MKQIVVLAFLLAFSSLAFAQSAADLKLAEDFRKAADDSIFIQKHSAESFRIYMIDNQLDNSLTTDGATVFDLDPQQLYGPIETDSAYIWVKVIAVDSLYRMRAGNIFIDPKGSSAKKAKALAENILKQLQKGASYDAMCQKYKNDSNENFECDLGWFFQGRMVPEFENEILKHKKGDYFVTQTEFGYHVVKILDNPVKDRQQVRLVQLVRLK